MARFRVRFSKVFAEQTCRKIELATIDFECQFVGYDSFDPRAFCGKAALKSRVDEQPKKPDLRTARRSRKPLRNDGRRSSSGLSPVPGSGQQRRSWPNGVSVEVQID